MRQIARQAVVVTESDVRNLHRLVMQRSAPDITGRYADQGRYVLTDKGWHGFPSPAEVPALMGNYAAWIKSTPPPRKRRSTRTDGWSISIRSTMATGAPRGC